MITKVCKICNKEFEIKPYVAKKGGGKYCSSNCYHTSSLGRKPWNKKLKGWRKIVLTGRVIKCIVCGKEKYYQLNEHKSRQRKYCSHACFHLNTQKEILSYSGLHSWIKRQIGKASKCEYCGVQENIDWANKSHEYKKDTTDWISLCRKHHIAYDKGRLEVNTI